MTSSASLFSTAIDAVRHAVAGIPDTLSSVKDLGDDELLANQRELSELRRVIDARSSLLAGEIAFRSRRELGYSGLAQKEGFQNAEKLVQATTGATRREAATLVTTGNLVHESMVMDAVDPATGEIPVGFVALEPWLIEVGAAVASGLLAIDAARSIRSGLGSPGGAESGAESGVTEDALAEAARTLLEAAGVVGRRGEDSMESPRGLNSDELYRMARGLRDELDEAGIGEREQLLYSQRSLRKIMKPNGLSRYTLDPDLEMSVWLDDVYDKLTAPRRGGPRFVDPGDREWSDAIMNDTRSTEQYLHDAFLGLLRKGVEADQAEALDLEATVSDALALEGPALDALALTGPIPDALALEGPAPDVSALKGPEKERRTARRRPRIVGSRMPAVRVLVTETALRTRTGHGRIEGSDIPVSIETVERHVCESGTLPIQFGESWNVIDLGRESRLFTSRQKVALAARDGGCLFGNCDRPASWTEAHHINHWVRDGGRTDLADGVLLCRHHHMLVHNNHWEIVRRDFTYWLVPPPEIDPLRRPRKLESKSAALRDLKRDQLLRDQALQDQALRDQALRDQTLRDQTQPLWQLTSA